MATMTDLESYFDFSQPGEIRIQGHRIWMHDILCEYIHREQTVEELAERFPSLKRDELLAALLYYHQNKDAMDKHLAGYLAYCRRSREAQRQSKDPFFVKLRRRVAELKEGKARAGEKVAHR